MPQPPPNPPGPPDPLACAAAARTLLVAADFDGTIAPLTPEPQLSRADPRARAALARLAALPGTTVAVISGRARADLRLRLAPPPDWRLVGSHGAELDSDADPAPDQGCTALLLSAARRFQDLRQEFPRAVVERKPFGVAFHWRALPADRHAAAEAAARAVAGAFHTLRVVAGSMALEVTTSRATKGDALSALRSALNPAFTLFIGDDTTDEDAFAHLERHATEASGLGVKVGRGPTRARLTLTDVGAVASLLDRLADARTLATRG
jgi:trehalose-phosphatase